MGRPGTAARTRLLIVLQQREALGKWIRKVMTDQKADRSDAGRIREQELADQDLGD
jgi:hypothetical protein